MISVQSTFHVQPDNGLRPSHLAGSCGVEVARSDFNYCASCGPSTCTHRNITRATSLPLLCPPLNATELTYSHSSLPSDPSLYSLSSSTSTANPPMHDSPVPMTVSEQQPPTQRSAKPHPTLPSLSKLTTMSYGLPSPTLPEKNRKAKYVDSLVDTTALVITSIWHTQPGSKKTKLVTLRVFIQEVLRRSRTTYSTLQTALFYLFRVKNLIIGRQKDAASKDESDTAIFSVPTSDSSTVQCNEDDLINCGRRMFLASLMIASKYLQDKNYRNKAWAKIAGLSVAEINATEIAFLKLIDYNLFISKATFERWYGLLHGHVNALCCVEGNSFREEQPNMSAAGDMLFQTSTDNTAAYDTPLPSPTSPNPPRLPSPVSLVTSSTTSSAASSPASSSSSSSPLTSTSASASASSSSSCSTLTPETGALSHSGWTSPVESATHMVDRGHVCAPVPSKFPVATHAAQNYQSPSPSPPPRKASSLRHASVPSLRRQATTTAALLQNVAAPVIIRPPFSVLVTHGRQASAPPAIEPSRFSSSTGVSSLPGFTSAVTVPRYPSPPENANGKRLLEDREGPEAADLGKKPRVEDDGYISDEGMLI